MSHLNNLLSMHRTNQIKNNNRNKKKVTQRVIQIQVIKKYLTQKVLLICETYNVLYIIFFIPIEFSNFKYSN